MIRLFLLLLILLTAFISLKAQKNAYFGQPYLNPMSVNAAMTGSMNNQNRLILNYKNWDISAYKENFFAVAYEHRFDLKSGDYIGIGTHIGQSDMGILEQKQVKAAFAYSKYLGGNGQGNTHYLMAGADIGLQNSILDLNRNSVLAFNNYTTGNGAGFPIHKIDSFYVSTGALWCATWKNGRSAHLGIALHRIFSPLITLSHTLNLPLLWRSTFQGGIELPIRRHIRLVPTLIYMKQGQNTDIRSSLAFKLAQNNVKSLQFGIFSRHFKNSSEQELKENSIGFFGRLDMPTYSVNVSNELTSPTSLEFAVIYRFGDLLNEHAQVPAW